MLSPLQGLFSRITFREDLYLGGYRNLSMIGERTGMNWGFVGCIRQLVVNNKVYDMRKGAYVGDAIHGVDVGKFCYEKDIVPRYILPKLSRLTSTRMRTSILRVSRPRHGLLLLRTVLTPIRPCTTVTEERTQAGRMKTTIFDVSV